MVNDVVALTVGNQLNNNGAGQNAGVFAIQTKGGETIALVTVGGGNAQTATDTSQVHTASAIISATSVTAGRTNTHG